MRMAWKFAIGIFVCASLAGFAMESAATNGSEKKADCSHLSADELQFAFGLTEANKALFCGTFTSVQRAAAMQLTSQPSPTGALLSPDDAVAKVAEVNSSASGTNKPRGVCPVK